MADSDTAPRIPIIRLVMIPALISLAMTLLRLAGELGHWSERWFSTETGGTTPHGVSWVFGITWLAAPFGIYFALKLIDAQERPASAARAVAIAAVGMIILIGFPYPLSTLQMGFPNVLIVIWLFMAIGGALQYFAWPALFKVLLAYGLAARIPVVIVMFFAMLGNWGTHYDYVGMPPQFAMPLVPRFLWLAFFPQLVFWVAFTIVAGSICGTLAAAFIRIKPPAQSIDIAGIG
jgi:hypothetical protein